MEDSYIELLENFRNFKIDKFAELDGVREDQENKFKNFISVSEEVSEHLYSSIRELKMQVKDLKEELVSLRAAKYDQLMKYQRRLMEEEEKQDFLKFRLKIEKEKSQAQAINMDSLRDAKVEEIMDCRKLLMEEKQKNKELSDENKRLKQQQVKLISSRLKNTKDAQLCITTTTAGAATSGGHVARETTKHTKRSSVRRMGVKCKEDGFSSSLKLFGRGDEDVHDELTPRD